MEQNNVEDANTSAPVHTGAHPFGDWLTVQEAVAYCVSKGLNRTPKTVRKWAHRSGDAERGNADVVARQQDIGNGFRWLIERVSLDIKIEQEREFEQRTNSEISEVNTSAPVGTGAHPFEQVPVEGTSPSETHTDANTSAPVHTGAHRDDDIVDFLKRQIEVKDHQIEALLERDRETNILIQGSQGSLTGVVDALPGARRDHELGHFVDTEHQTPTRTPDTDPPRDRERG